MRAFLLFLVEPIAYEFRPVNQGSINDYSSLSPCKSGMNVLPDSVAESSYACFSLRSGTFNFSPSTSWEGISSSKCATQFSRARRLSFELRMCQGGLLAAHGGQRTLKAATLGIERDDAHGYSTKQFANNGSIARSADASDAFSGMDRMVK